MSPTPKAPVPSHAVSPQIGRIARLLHLDPSEVTGLDGVPDADLRTLHDQISKRLFGDAQRQFARVAALSKTIPGPLAGVLAEKFLPPVMAARVSEMLDPAKARDLIGRVSVTYLAEIALALDPVRSKPVVQKLPPEPIGKVAKELFGRQEYAAMAEFVGTVTTDALMAAFEVATPHDLLAVVPLLEWNDNLDVVVADLPHHKVTQIATSLTPVELADLAMALDPSRMGPIVAAVPAEVVAGIAKALFERGEYAGMARFVGVVTPEMLHAAFEVATPHDLLAVVPLLEWNDNLDHVIEELPEGQVEAIAAELDPGEMADLAVGLDPSRMGPILRVVPPATVAEVARVLFARKQVAEMVKFVDVIDDIPDEVVDALLGEIAEGEDWDSAQQAFEEVGPEAQARLFSRFDGLAPAHQARIRAAADAGELGPAATALLTGKP
ncbi:hypothetical protein [Nocardioides marmorisolisilvae]|uniref:Uncharacterized protein n=1 Tax=Nocardioides marmorisolisilvae TaxID=1542737 RepID=A0A3N0DQ52_9ACTN|nr:hypothetical protein [Nocardioides marmorisolisilvae]RNL77780.1 hypothetical protein EFL95_17470 [Nocardioides marmorisolisilvae]